MTLDLDISAPEEGDFSVDMTVEIDAYNADVTIPDAPEDALAFDELFGGEGGEGFGFEDFFGGEGGDSSGFDDLFGAGS